MGTNLLAEQKEEQVNLQGFVIEKLPVENYEQVLKIAHEKSGLKAIIAIHNTILGPSLGGIRIYPYASFDQAMEDVLRLSKGMTYKSAVSEVGFGGGKSVIIADPKTNKTEALLVAFGQAVNSLKGRYICAEDVGCSVQDMAVVRKATKYVVGLAHKKSSGNPAPFTAFGTFRGLQAALNKVYGSDSVRGKKVVIQGVGSVGELLAEQLFWQGAKVVISDVNQAKLEELQHKFGFEIIAPDKVFDVECDVFTPCAMGGILNDQTLPRLKCKIVAGCANNQLLKAEHGDALKDKGILYAPDFVINAGGLINVAAELLKKGYSSQESRNKIDKIYDVLTSIFNIAEKNNISTSRAAIELGDHRLKNNIGKRIEEPHFHH